MSHNISCEGCGSTVDPEASTTMRLRMAWVTEKGVTLGPLGPVKAFAHRTCVKDAEPKKESPGQLSIENFDAALVTQVEAAALVPEDA